jgi:hypothetical protein
MKNIFLTKNKYAIVDDDDYYVLSRWKWHLVVADKAFYAARSSLIKYGEKRKRIYMHRFIMQPEHGMEVDHINGDGLDNRKINLRVCLHSENKQNLHARYGSSRYKGVWWNNERQKWEAGIKTNSKKVFLGRFKDEFEAALAYNRAAINYFGEFANLNIL